MKSKRGQSEVITTVLIILLVLAAIIIVWQVVQGVLNKGKTSIDAQSNCIGLNLAVASANSSNELVIVTRNTGNPSASIVNETVFVNGAKAGTNNTELVELSSARINLTATPANSVNLAPGDKVQVAAILSDGTVCPLSPEVTAQNL